MRPSRSDLSQLGKKPPYAFLSLLFLSLSFALLYFFRQIYLPESTLLVESTPLDVPDENEELSNRGPSVAILPTLGHTSPTPLDDSVYPTGAAPSVESIPLDVVDLAPSGIKDYPTGTPNPASHLGFTSPDSDFSLTYSSNRTLYQDKTNYGHRYTFYSPDSSFSVHVGQTDWSWTHPNRQFSSSFQIDGLDTFRYDINLQTLVDVVNNGQKYTIQCIHNNLEEVKTECQQFLSSFKFL